MPSAPDDGELVPDSKVVGYASPNPKIACTASKTTKSRHDPTVADLYMPGQTNLNGNAEDVHQSRNQFEEHVVMKGKAIADVLENMSRSQHPMDGDNKYSHARGTLLAMLKAYEHAEDSPAVTNTEDLQLLAPPNSGHPNFLGFPHNAVHPNFLGFPHNAVHPDFLGFPHNAVHPNFLGFPPNVGHPNFSSLPYVSHPYFAGFPGDIGQPDMPVSPFHRDIGQHVFSNLLSQYVKPKQGSTALTNPVNFDAAYCGQPGFSDVPSRHRKRKHDSEPATSSGNVRGVTAPIVAQPDFSSSAHKKIGQPDSSDAASPHRKRNKGSAAITDSRKSVKDIAPNVAQDEERNGDSTDGHSDRDPDKKELEDRNSLRRIEDYLRVLRPKSDGGDPALRATDSLAPDSASYFADLSSDVCEPDFTEKRRMLSRTSTRNRLAAKSFSEDGTRDELDVVGDVAGPDWLDCPSSFSSPDESDDEPRIPRTKARKTSVKTRDRLSKRNVRHNTTSAASHPPNTLYCTILKCVKTQIDYPSGTSNSDVTNPVTEKSEVLPNTSNPEPPQESEATMEIDSDVVVSKDTDRGTLHSKTNESESSGSNTSNLVPLQEIEVSLKVDSSVAVSEDMDRGTLHSKTNESRSSGADKGFPFTKESDQILDSKSRGSEASGMGDDKQDVPLQKRRGPLSELDNETWMKRLLAQTCNAPSGKKTRALKPGDVQDAELEDDQSDQENTAPEIISRKRKQGLGSGEGEVDKRSRNKKPNSGDDPSSYQ